MRDTYGGGDLPPTSGGKRKATGLRHSIRARSLRDDDEGPVATPAQPKREAVAPKRPVAPVKPQRRAPTPRYTPDADMPRWHELTRVDAGNRLTAETDLPVVDGDRNSTTVRAFDLLRTRLRQTTQEHGWTNIAVASPTRNCGNTFTAANLALSLSRISASRTVLMDMNLRHPSVAKAFDISPRGAMLDFLAGRTAIGDHMIRVSDTLALGLNTSPVDNAADTLQADQTARTLERMRAALQPELVIYDLPPMLVNDDIQAFLPQIDGVLLVSDGTQTVPRDLLACEKMLQDRVPLLGVVLNRARANSIPRYN